MSPWKQTTGAMSAPAAAASGWPLRLVIACVWLLTLLTITPLERDGVNDVASIDWLASVKLVVRLGALVVLALLLMRFRRATSVKLFVPLGLFLAWAMVSTAWSPLRAVSLGQAVSLLVLCLLAWAVASVDQGEATRRRLMAHLTVVLCVFSLLMILAYITIGGGGDRFAFVLAHPTGVSGTASLGAVLLLASAVVWRWRWARLLLVPGLALHGLVLLAAHNRSALIATAVAVALLLAAYADRLLLTAAALAGSAALLAVPFLDPGWSWASAGGSQVVTFMEREQDVSQLAAFSGREELWQVMWDSYLASPWIGHGYFVTSSEGVLEIWNREVNFNAHNMPFQALVSTGLAGTLLFVWALGRPLWFAVKRCSRASQADRTAGVFVLVSLWTWCWGMMDAALLGPVLPYSIAFFVVLGLLAGTAEYEAAAASAPKGRDALAGAAGLYGGSRVGGDPAAQGGAY